MLAKYWFWKMMALRYALRKAGSLPCSMLCGTNFSSVCFVTKLGDEFIQYIDMWSVAIYGEGGCCHFPRRAPEGDILGVSDLKFW